jgi:7-cyano-7-deazaguanine reductase
MNDPLSAAPLGQASVTPQAYDAGLLFPIPRRMTRDELGLSEALPFIGHDAWTAYELGWLNRKGKPQVGVAHISVPCETPFMIESKSFKLYLNSLNGERMATVQDLVRRIEDDINRVLWGEHTVMARASCQVLTPEAFGACALGELEGLSLDRLDIDVDEDSDTALRVHAEEPVVTETLRSDLLRALCRVTGQPDWGSVQIDYVGQPIDQERLLRYIIGFRNQQEFHEPLAERMFMDIWRACRPLKLRVLLRFTRRGGMDINPMRSSYPLGHGAVFTRLARQ